MATLDRIILGIYVLAMVALFILGNCSLEKPMFIIGAVFAFISVVAIVRQTLPKDDN